MRDLLIIIINQNYVESKILRFYKKLYVFDHEPLKPVHVCLNCPLTRLKRRLSVEQTA